MRTVLLKYALLLPLILFFIWLGLVIFGCMACFFGATETYYCTNYCMIAKISVSMILAAYVIFFARSLFYANKK